VGYSKAAREVLDLFRKKGVGRCLSEQPFYRGAIACTRCRLDRIGLRDASTGTRDIGETMNP
jgi:hypothetical protein